MRQYPAELVAEAVGGFIIAGSGDGVSALRGFIDKIILSGLLVGLLAALIGRSGRFFSVYGRPVEAIPGRARLIGV